MYLYFIYLLGRLNLGIIIIPVFGGELGHLLKFFLDFSLGFLFFFRVMRLFPIFWFPRILTAPWRTFQPIGVYFLLRKTLQFHESFSSARENFSQWASLSSSLWGYLSSTSDICPLLLFLTDYATYPSGSKTSISEDSEASVEDKIRRCLWIPQYFFLHWVTWAKLFHYYSNIVLHILPINVFYYILAYNSHSNSFS